MITADELRGVVSTRGLPRGVKRVVPGLNQVREDDRKIREREKHQRWANGNGREYLERTRALRAEQSKAWRKANPEKVKAMRKRWREKNPEKYRAMLRRQAAKSYAKDPKKFSEKQRAWREKNPERERAVKLRYYAKHREDIRARQRKYHEANKDRLNAARRARYYAAKESKQP